MTSSGRWRLLPRLFGVLLDVLGDAGDERVRQPLLDRQLPPAQVLFTRLLLALEAGRRVQQPFGRVRPAVEDDVLDQLAQIARDVLINGDLPGVDDAHVHAGGDRVIEEHRVHRLAHRIVAAEGERDVGDAAGDVHARQAFLDPPRRLEEGDGVAVVLLDAGGDGEDVRIEDDVLGREADPLGEQPVAALADRELALRGVRLPLLVERHDDDGGAVSADLAGERQERLLALLEADRVDDALALQALQPRLDDRPLRGVDHHRHPGDVRLGGDQVEEADHRRLRVQHRLVHVDVDDLSAVGDLLAGDLDRRPRSRRPGSACGTWRSR